MAVKGECVVQNIIQKILESNITVNILMPIIVLLLGWRKNESDLKRKNKEIGYWKIECRRIFTFTDTAMKMYEWFAINLVIMQIVRIVLFLWKGTGFSYFVSGSLYLMFNVFIIFIVCREAKVRIEFWSDGMKKKSLIAVLYVIYGVVFFMELFGKYEYIVEIVFIVSLISWIFFLFKDSDLVFILDNMYADIYVKGSEKAELAEAGSIKKQGEWIIVNRNINGYNEEIRIKESDIARIDYYGGPMIAVEKRKWFNTSE